MKKLKSAELPVDERGVLYHIELKPGDVPRYVLLPGDPGRVKIIAKFWDEAREVSAHREYYTYVGKYKGVPIATTSTGIGGPATAIAVEELLMVGADTFIRVGTTGALKEEIGIGDVIISTAAVRFDGTSHIYVDSGYPAVASYEIVLALIEAAETLNVPYHVGITASTDSFYIGQGRPGYNNYLPEKWKDIDRKLAEVNVLNFEMEAATLFTLANIYGARAGAICAAIANRATGEFVAGAGVEDAVKVANEAVKLLYEWDSMKKRFNKKYLSLTLLKQSMK